LTALTIAMGIGNDPAGMLFDDTTDARRRRASKA
jgi:hypothetical protein